MLQKFLTKKLEADFAKQGYTGDKEDDEIKIIAHYFFANLDWWVYERDTDDPNLLWAFVNLGDPEMAESGSMLASDLINIKVQGIYHIERDLYWNQETTLEDIKRKVKPWLYPDEKTA